MMGNQRRAVRSDEDFAGMRVIDGGFQLINDRLILEINQATSGWRNIREGELDDVERWTSKCLGSFASDFDDARSRQGLALAACVNA